MGEPLRIGIIGGSGLYDFPGLERLGERVVETPYGPPSDALVHARLPEAPGVELYFLPRHSEVPYRANIWALKSLGVSWVVSVSAVGSLRADIIPGHVVVVDQFIDRTRGRPQSFFEKGIVAHVAFGDPVCPVLRGILLDAARAAGATAHDGGTYLCMEGPAFSTKAESRLHRSWGCDVVGMTNLPEAKLAREAELAYATLAFSTDFDAWHDAHDAVTVEQVIAVLHANVALAQRIVREAIPRIAANTAASPAHQALTNAIMTDRTRIPEDARARLAPLLARVLA
jgi:5'-methylthioadenosine phosphorylase